MVWGFDSTALLTDRYELTMLEAALRSGVAHRRAVFEVFARNLPSGRRYGVVAGTGRLVEALQQFRFGRAQLESLRFLDARTLEWLAAFRFRGQVDGFPEGELYFPGSPIVTVEGAFGEALILETLALSILNHDSAVASAATRMVAAARGRPLIEMGARRTHEVAAVAAARAACLCGFSSTSSLQAGLLYGLPTTGTAAHAFTLAHRTEEEAFAAQVRAFGPGTTLLVDTYDVDLGLRAAVEACRRVGASGPGAVRIDSGDLLAEARRARRALDALGATETRILASGDLDEFSIDALERAPGGRAPIDAYGVGTRVVTGSGAPTAELVYKLVAIADRPGDDAPLRPVSKRSAAKVTIGGRKHVVRALDEQGRAVEDRLSLRPPPPDERCRVLQARLVSDGEAVHTPSVGEANEHHRAALAELPPPALAIEPGPPAIAVTWPRLS